jgi:hypothetical protein
MAPPSWLQHRRQGTFGASFPAGRTPDPNSEKNRTKALPLASEQVHNPPPLRHEEIGADASLSKGSILMRRTLSAFTFLVLAAAAAGLLWAEDNPFLGTWKLNVEKSKFESVPAPKSQTRTIAVQGNGVKYSFEGVSSDGTPFAYSFVTYYDGTEAAITGNGTPAGADAITLKRINSHKTEGTLHKGGKDVGKVTAEVSKDGKVATVKAKGKTADGREYSTESVYDKQ